MSERPLRILQVNTTDTRGGAAAVAWNLHRSCREQGMQSWMAVGQKFSGDPAVEPIPNERYRSPTARHLRAAAQRLTGPHSRGRAARLAARTLQGMAEPDRALAVLRGKEDFAHPGSHQLLNLFPDSPDLVHCHNLHGGYFDLRALPILSRRAPVLLTLHDAWLLSGHCSHSFDCDRWTSGCGACPDLSIYPAIRRDATADNWKRKRDIYGRCRLFVATPSSWLMRRVERSMLAPAIAEARVIPNGVDLSVFRPGNRDEARAALGLPRDAAVVLFVAEGIRQNPFKDYVTARATVSELAGRFKDRTVVFLALGEAGPAEPMGKAEVRFVPYQSDAGAVAQYYQAADVYFHAARAETFPTVILEALACGTPVVATDIGGIPEQVETLDGTGATNHPTGILTPVGNAPAAADAIERLVRDPALSATLSANAVHDVRRRFDLRDQVRRYIDWYREIITAMPVDQLEEDPDDALPSAS